MWLCSRLRSRRRFAFKLLSLNSNMCILTSTTRSSLGNGVQHYVGSQSTRRATPHRSSVVQYADSQIYTRRGCIRLAGVLTEYHVWEKKMAWYLQIEFYFLDISIISQRKALSQRRLLLQVKFCSTATRRRVESSSPNLTWGFRQPLHSIFKMSKPHQWKVKIWCRECRFDSDTTFSGWNCFLYWSLTL